MVFTPKVFTFIYSALSAAYREKKNLYLQPSLRDSMGKAAYLSLPTFNLLELMRKVLCQVETL